LLLLFIIPFSAPHKADGIENFDESVALCINLKVSTIIIIISTGKQINKYEIENNHSKINFKEF